MGVSLLWHYDSTPEEDAKMNVGPNDPILPAKLAYVDAGALFR